MLAEEKNKHGPGSCCAPIKTTNTATTMTTAKDREHAMNTLAHGVCASCGVTRMPVSFLSCFVLQLLSSVISMIFVFLFVCPGPDYCVCVCVCACVFVVMPGFCVFFMRLLSFHFARPLHDCCLFLCGVFRRILSLLFSLCVPCLVTMVFIVEVSLDACRVSLQRYRLASRRAFLQL